jgi:hypothetical protein
MYIQHIKLYSANSQYQKQIGYDTYDDRMWVRTKSANTWSTWKAILTSDNIGEYALTSLPAHTHTIANVTGLQTALDGKASSSHTHGAGDITSGTLSADRLPTQELGISIAGNFGQWQLHSAYTNFNTAVNYWGWNYVQGNTNAPHQTSSQWYRGRFSLGNEYGFGNDPGDYWMEIAIPRYNQDSTAGNLFVRTAENGGINAWQGVRAAYATTAGTAADADTLDGYHETSFIRLAANSSSPTNGTFAIGSASGRNFIQSHSGQPLDINPLGNGVNVGSDLTVSGTITENSSIRYKENVKSIPNVSQKVEQLDAVSYNKIGSNQEEIGLIAEDVAELFPEVVKYDNDGRPDGVNYSRLSVILLKAVQELTERVNKLENK